MIKDQPRAIVNMQDRAAAVAAMEPKLRALYAASTPMFGSLSSRVIAGNLTVDFSPAQGEVSFWVAKRHTIFSGSLDPVKPGKYCDGRIHVRTWIRGVWEADLGANVESHDPLISGILPKNLIRQIRTGLKCWPTLAPQSEAAFGTIVACLTEPFDAMLEAALARKESSDAQVDTVMLTLPTPQFSMVTALLLALNFARPSHVKTAWTIACDQATAWKIDGQQIAQGIVGAKNSLQPILDYMEKPAPTDDEAELARDLFNHAHTFMGWIDPDGGRAGHLIDRMALFFKQRGIS